MPEKRLERSSHLEQIKTLGLRLADLDRYIREFMDSAPSLFWIASLDGQTVYYASSAVKEMFDLTPEEVKADPAAWYAKIDQRDRERVIRAIESRDMSNGATFFTVYRVNVDIGTRWYESRFFTISDKAGTPVRVGGYVIDITEGCPMLNTQGLGERCDNLNGCNNG